MRQSGSLRLGAREASIVGVFAALHAVVSLLPFTMSVGVPGGQITLGVITAPLIGILLGPLLGGGAVMIGALVAGFMNPAGAIFGVVSFVPPTIGAIGAGSVRSARSYLAGLMIVVSVVVFYSHPFGREVMYYPWLQLVAAAIAFLPLSGVYRTGFSASTVKRNVPVFVVAAFVGTLSDHASGSAMGVWYFSAFLGPEIWKAIAFVYPVERIVATILCSIVGIPVYRRLKVTGLLDVFG